MRTSTSTEANLHDFLGSVSEHLRSQNVTTVHLRHPTQIYDQFVDTSWLESAGLTKDFEDVSQHICLDDNWESSIHTMQRRKLISLEQEGFEFGLMTNEQLEVAHKFLQVCRAAQDLELNISYELLAKLAESNRYQIFCVKREEKISALCIAVEPTENIAYYYLPATSPMFRSQSPMVLLIAGMVAHYRSKGFKYLDLGASSYKGKPQETLRLFKNRMGASEGLITSWKMQL